MAIEKVRDRLLRVTAALNEAQLPYAVAGGNAVAEWVGRVDQAAVRFTQDVDLLIRRSDLPAIIGALQRVGFIYHQTLDVHMFLDGPNASPRDAVHVIFSGEKVRAENLVPAPAIEESEPTAEFLVLSLEALVRMKLTSYRDRDKTHLRDMLDVGLLDPSWCVRFPTELAGRLQALIDAPES